MLAPRAACDYLVTDYDAFLEFDCLKLIVSLKALVQLEKYFRLVSQSEATAEVSLLAAVADKTLCLTT